MMGLLCAAGSLVSGVSEDSVETGDVQEEGVPPGARRKTAQPNWQVPCAALAVRSTPATAAAGDAGGHVDALDGARRRLVVLELVVDLEPVALGVSHNQSTVMHIEDRSRGKSEPPFLLEVAHFATPLYRAGVGLQSHLGPFGEFLSVTHKTGDNFAIRIEDLDAVVGPVAHIHITIGVDGYAGGTVQLARACPVAAELADELSIRGELLDAVVLMIGDVHLVLLVYGNAPWGIELTLGAAEAAPLHQELTVLGEFLYTMVAAVDDIQNILRVDGDPRGGIELTVTASGGAPIAQEVAVLIEEGDAVEPLVGDVHVFLAIKRQASGPDELPRAISGAADIGYKLFIARHRSDGELPHTGPHIALVPGHFLDLLCTAV